MHLHCRKQGAEQAGRGGGSSLSGRGQSYLYIYILGGGGWAWGEPVGWPSFAEIKSLSLRLGKIEPGCLCVRTGARGWGEGLQGGGAGEEGVHADLRSKSQSVFCSTAALIGWDSGAPANKAEGSWFSSVETLETQKRRAPHTEPQAYRDVTTSAE